MYGGLKPTARRRRGISPVVAELILIVIAVSAGYFLYSHVQSYISQTTGNAKSPAMIVVDAAQISRNSPNYCAKIAVRNVGATPARVIAALLLNPGDLSLIATGDISTPIEIPPGSSTVVENVCFGNDVPSGTAILKVVTDDGSSASIKVVVP